ncbi:MAG: hypothetical protein JJT96_04435 [Opitutales bacterium]|nr:hypothetical protein [Opitutales bacterium]
MKKNRSPLLATAGLMLFAATVAHSQVSLIVPFNDGDLSNFRNETPANWSIVSGSGALTAASDGDIDSINGTYLNQSFSLPANGFSLTLEATYLWHGRNIRASNVDALRIGLTTSSTGDALPEYSGVLRPTASGNRNHRVGNYSGTNLVQSGSNTNITNSAVPLILETVFTRVSPTEMTMATTLWNDGKLTTQIPTVTRSITVAEGYFDNPFFAGLFINGDASREDLTTWTSEIRIDNFTVTAIPEPRVYAALFGLFALGFVIWRRRRLTR